MAARFIEVGNETQTAHKKNKERIMPGFFGSVVSQLVPITAILMVFSIPIIAIITEYLEKKEKMRLLEKAIEKGATIDSLSLVNQKKPSIPYRKGMVTFAIGLGAFISGFFLGRHNQSIFIGGGAILLLIGAALIINDKLNYERLYSEKEDNGDNIRVPHDEVDKS
jgi:hypothetical protein